MPIDYSVQISNFVSFVLVFIYFLLELSIFSTLSMLKWNMIISIEGDSRWFEVRKT